MEKGNVRTDGRTDGHTLLWRCLAASKNWLGKFVFDYFYCLPCKMRNGDNSMKEVVRFYEGFKREKKNLEQLDWNHMKDLSE